MIKKLLLLKVALWIITQGVYAQENVSPFELQSSQKFQTLNGFILKDPLVLDNGEIIQVSANKIEAFSFQRFSKQLVLQEERVVNTKLMVENTRFDRMVRFKNKMYLFVRQIDKETREEVVAALEFFPDKLDFVGGIQPLFQSSGRLKNFLQEGKPIGFMTLNVAPYHFKTSKDSTKFLYAYTILPVDKKEEGGTKIDRALEKDTVGIYVYNENLKKQWGGEFEMPYPRNMMHNLDYTLANDGKVYLLAKVYNAKPGEERKMLESQNQITYHYEILIYDKANKEPAIVQLRTDQYYPSGSFLYQDDKQNIIIAGCYSKDLKNLHLSDGLFMIKLDPEKNTLTKVNSGYYEIPSEIIKQYLSDKQKEKVKLLEQEGDLGLNSLKLQKIYTTPGGCIKIISEVYGDFGNGAVGLDAFVMSIDKEGKMEWVKKIHKIQHASWEAVSFNSYMSREDVNMFYLESPKLLAKLSDKQDPKEVEKGYLIKAVRIDKDGNEFYYTLGNTTEFDTKFCIRDFVNGGRQNLVRAQRSMKRNTMLSIQNKAL